MRLQHVLYSFAFFAAAVRAQTETVVDPDSGATVVEVVTENAAGVVTTQTLQTVTDTDTTTPQATTTQDTTTQDNIVGEPGTTTGAGTIAYVYSTTNAAGATTVINAVFTPSFPNTVLPSTTTTGTVMGFSQWLSLIGTHTGQLYAGAEPVAVPTGLKGVAFSLVVSVVGGAWLLLA